MKKYVKGFTLIELLVVIVIIGILSGIGISAFNSYFGKARDAKEFAQVRQLVSIFNAYAISENGGENPDTRTSQAVCIGLEDADTCWGGQMRGDTNLKNSMERHLTLSGEAVTTDEYGENYLYLKGILPLSICAPIGTTNGYQDITGAFILYRPDSIEQAAGNYTCGLGSIACCGQGPCNGGGYFCAVPIGNYEITGD